MQRRLVALLDGEVAARERVVHLCARVQHGAPERLEDRAAARERVVGPAHHHDPFFVLDPERLADPPRKAASIKGAARSARTVSPDAMEPVDLVVTGCVAVGKDGARLGKGGGFSDLEFALAAAAGLVDARTVAVTTVHEVQVQPAGAIPTTAHDIAVDLVVTPDRVIATRGGRRRVPELDWGELSAEKIAAIPLLARLAP
jgi:5-formyltetrahydrofolate cyclo-ligase